MAKRTFEQVVNDIKDALAQSNLNESELRDKVSEHTVELEDMLKKEKAENKFFGFILLLLSFFLVIFAFITYLDNEDLRDSVTEKKEIITKYENITRKDTIKTYSDIKGEKLTVENLLNENLELLKKVSDYEFKIYKYETYLDHIKRQYGIIIIDENHSIRTKGEKVDSAMILLAVYRDKLKYDSTKKHWYITNTYTTHKETTKVEISKPDTAKKE